MTEKKYSKDHEWIEIKDGTATVGITNHAQESLGDIVFVDMPEKGKKVIANAEVCVIESVKAASDIFSPVDGEIIEINESLIDNGALVNQDPENTGWIFKINPSDLSQLDNLMSLSEYKEFIKE
tara:strand:+ start:412 stop:783 length:372 start_codon:yes stop_codon:yes gene_type:complete